MDNSPPQANMEEKREQLEMKDTKCNEVDIVS